MFQEIRPSSVRICPEQMGHFLLQTDCRILHQWRIALSLLLRLFRLHTLSCHRIRFGFKILAKTYSFREKIGQRLFKSNRLKGLCNTVTNYNIYNFTAYLYVFLQQCSLPNGYTCKICVSYRTDILI